MNGRLLLDMNAVIALLNGNANLNQMCSQATWIGISIITELEFLSFPGLSAGDAALFQQFKSRVQVISLEESNAVLKSTTIQLRQSFGIKLPDAIIAASAVIQQADLVSNDSVFGRVSALRTQIF